MDKQSDVEWINCEIGYEKVFGFWHWVGGSALLRQCSAAAVLDLSAGVEIAMIRIEQVLIDLSLKVGVAVAAVLCCGSASPIFRS